MRYVLMLTALSMLLVGCQKDTLKGKDAVSVGEPLYSISFDDPSSFETGDFPEGSANLSILEGKYRLQQGGDRTAYIWGQGGEVAQNVSVEVHAQPLSAFTNDLYGVMCRLNDEGAGYAFLVSSDGFGAIARTNGKSLTFLFDWTENRAIKKGQTSNTIRAVCVENYLALYVNDTLIGDVEDSEYPQGGQVGVLGGIFIEAPTKTGEVVVEFDDLSVNAASLK